MDISRSLTAALVDWCEEKLPFLTRSCRLRRRRCCHWKPSSRPPLPTIAAVDTDPDWPLLNCTFSPTNTDWLALLFVWVELN